MSDDSMPGKQQDRPIPEHRSILFLGVSEWNKWRCENPNIKPQLRLCYIRGRNFAEANFSNADLSEVDFRHSDLTEANFEDANLSGATLEGTRLERASFAGADLRMVNLNFASLRGANLRGTDLSKTLYLEQEQVDVAEGNWLTSLPPGLTYPHHWEKEPKPKLEPLPFSELSTPIFPPPRSIASMLSGETMPPIVEPESAATTDSIPLLQDVPSPIIMAWNAEGKIAVVAPKERPPARGLSPATRDLLAQALTDAAADLAKHIRSGNSDQNIANRLDAYARECAKGGAQLNVLRLDAIVRTLRNLAARDEDAFSYIDAAEFAVFTRNHDALTRFYPDFEDYQRALSSAPNIPAPPNLDLAKLLREPPGPDIIDVSIPDAIDDILPRGESLPDSRRTDTQETNERKFSLMKIVEGLKLALEMPGAAVSAIAAIRRLYAILKPLFDWLMLIF